MNIQWTKYAALAALIKPKMIVNIATRRASRGQGLGYSSAGAA